MNSSIEQHNPKVRIMKFKIGVQLRLPVADYPAGLNTGGHIATLDLILSSIIINIKLASYFTVALPSLHKQVQSEQLAPEPGWVL